MFQKISHNAERLLRLIDINQSERCLQYFVVELNQQHFHIMSVDTLTGYRIEAMKCPIYVMKPLAGC